MHPPRRRRATADFLASSHTHHTHTHTHTELSRLWQRDAPVATPDFSTLLFRPFTANMNRYLLLSRAFVLLEERVVLRFRSARSELFTCKQFRTIRPLSVDRSKKKRTTFKMNWPFVDRILDDNNFMRLWEMGRCEKHVGKIFQTEYIL